MTTRQVRAWVDVEDGEESVEGNWWTPEMQSFELLPTTDVCPFCKASLELIRAPLFGRIVKDEQDRRNGKTSAIVDLLPPTHDALKCSGCDFVFTRTKDQSWN